MASGSWFLPWPCLRFHLSQVELSRKQMLRRSQECQGSRGSRRGGAVRLGGRPASISAGQRGLGADVQALAPLSCLVMSWPSESPIFLQSNWAGMQRRPLEGAVNHMPSLKGRLGIASQCLPHQERTALPSGVGSPGISTLTPSGPRRAWWGRAPSEGNSSNRSEPRCTCVHRYVRGPSTGPTHACGSTCVYMHVYPRALYGRVRISSRVFRCVCVHMCSILWPSGGGGLPALGTSDRWRLGPATWLQPSLWEADWQSEAEPTAKRRRWLWGQGGSRGPWATRGAALTRFLGPRLSP